LDPSADATRFRERDALAARLDLGAFGVAGFDRSRRPGWAPSREPSAVRARRSLSASASSWSSRS
jgi:hypothetical protein